MARTKLIDDRFLVLVASLHEKGARGPVASWGMPSTAFGCGDHIGYQVCRVDVKKGEFVTYGWIFQDKSEARLHAAKERQQLRKFYKKLKRKEKSRTD